MSKHNDLSWSVYRPIGVTRRHENYIDGYVETPHGIVLTYSEQNYASAHLIYDGRSYMRTWNRSFSPRGLAIVAARFARGVAGGEVQ